MVVVGLIAVLHFGILWFEMFQWQRLGPKVFKSFPPALFAATKAMAANQGLYNGFLAAGLVWSLMIGDPVWAGRVAVFFLLCVAVAGVYGALTASRRILYVQTVPALVGFGLVWVE